MSTFSYPLILDGGLATELERSFGKDLSGALWSAKCLDDDPDAIKAVHTSYYRAGSHIVTTASYQASIAGYLRAGYSREKAIELMHQSVRLANQARVEHGKGFVAISMGCYGAVLANGAEYTGDYGAISLEELMDFHRERLDILLQEPGIDLILFETVPSYLEAQAIAKLISEHTALPPVGVSFSCRSDQHVADGTLLRSCIAEFDNLETVFAIGANCTKPKFIPGLLNVISDHNRDSGKAILLYPDGGEEWDAVNRSWISNTKISPEAFGQFMADLCHKFGPKMVLGGCCGTSPAHIRSMVQHFQDNQAPNA